MTNGMMTPSTAPDNPFFAEMVSAAERGDTLASSACLYVFGHALRDKKPLDPALAGYMGNCLIEAAQIFVTLRKEKTEKRATEVAKAMGLIAKRRGRRKPDFAPFRVSLDAISLVIYYHSKGHPLTRNDDGAIYKAAEILRSEPGTVEAAYLRAKENDVFLDADSHELTRAHAKQLIKISRRRRLNQSI